MRSDDMVPQPPWLRRNGFRFLHHETIYLGFGHQILDLQVAIAKKLIDLSCGKVYGVPSMTMGTKGIFFVDLIMSENG